MTEESKKRRSKQNKKGNNGSNSVVVVIPRRLAWRRFCFHDPVIKEQTNRRRVDRASRGKEKRALSVRGFFDCDS